ncbi:telomerase reverse transcriptase isoform X3 [Silene latifolia]|uniref:telomerase reverse transcriptase isoform X3 n=1 Tax=Silene latifolia TaxID=37657 RepID=UPI003D7807BF
MQRNTKYWRTITRPTYALAPCWIFPGNPRKKRRRNRKDSITEESPCKVSVQAVKFQQNSCHSVGNGNEGYDDRGCSEPSTLSRLTEASNGLEDLGSRKLEIHEGKSIEILEKKPRKRFRQPSWQRRKRCKRTVLEGSSTTVPSAELVIVEDDLNKTREHELTTDQWSGKVGPTSNKTCCNKQVDIKLLCPCCSVFRSLSPLPMDAQINRKPIFYNMKHSPSLFLEKHILNSLKPGFSGIKELLQDIFGLAIPDTENLPASCFHKKGFCSHASSCLYHSFVKSLKIFMWRAKKCQHVRLLQKHCTQVNLQSAREDSGSTLQGSKSKPVLASAKQETIQKLGKCRDCKRTPEVIQCQFGLTQPYCLKDEVVSFVWAVCRNILPPELLGSSSSRRILLRNISKFIKLRRFEKFSLCQCVHKLELSKFPLLSSTESSKETHGQKLRISQNIACKCNSLKRALLERWIFWLFTCIVVPLVQANFYVTESEHGKLNIYYYRKSTWEKLSDKITRSLKDQSYRYLDNASVAEILRKRSFGFSKVRLCPKEAGARPIANLKTPSRFCIGRSSSGNHMSGKFRKGRAPKGNNRATYFKSVNTILRDLHLVIKDVKRKKPERWGSTVFCYNDIHRKFCLFLRHLKEGQAAMPVVYLVVSDVQKAFDTIKQDKLLSILNEIQMADKYSMQKSNEIFCRKRSVWSSEEVKLMSQTDGSGCNEVMSSAHRKTFHRVSVNQEQSRTIRREELLLILKEHLKNNVLKLGQSFFLQTVGIPQGSVLSTLLCTLYYGHMENNVIVPYLAKGANDVAGHSDSGRVALEAMPDASFSFPKSMLLRFVDDYLFISTSKEQAVTFFSRLRRGFHEYNCYMNQEKFCTNFDYSSLQHGSKRMLVGSDGVCFLQWSGLLINSCNLEVQGDYSRYLNDHLSSTLTVNWQRNPGRKLKRKLCAYMRPKCHPIFFDATINSPATIKLNVYQAFLLCAMKFHCYVRELSTWCNLHPRTYLTSIEGSLRYMQKLMKRRMFKVKSTVLLVSKQEIQWLGLTAYIRVLNRKKSRHKELLSLLRPKLKPFSRIGGSPELQYAVDDSHSSLLWKIKY